MFAISFVQNTREPKQADMDRRTFLCAASIGSLAVAGCSDNSNVTTTKWRNDVAMGASQWNRNPQRVDSPEGTTENLTRPVDVAPFMERATTSLCYCQPKDAPPRGGELLSASSHSAFQSSRKVLRPCWQSECPQDTCYPRPALKAWKGSSGEFVDPLAGPL